MHPARNGPPRGEGLRREAVRAQACPAARPAAQEAEARQLIAPALRVGFAGTPDFAVHALRALIESGFTIPLVLTQPDRPHGRGLRSGASPVKAQALARGLRVEQPASLKDPVAREALLATPLDALVVAAYGLILPRAVLEWPRLGCINVHASLLPRWRGAAPVARAIEAGDAVSGVSIMQMDEGLDTGPVLAEAVVPIDPGETAGTLHDKLAARGARALVDVMTRLACGEALAGRPQPVEGATYARKIEPSEAALDWRLPADVLERRVRAFDPVPGAYARLRGERVKVTSPSVVAATPGVPAGTVIALGRDGIDVACGGAGALRVARLQPAGGKAMDADAFARGRNLHPGASFDLDPT